jgi:hypothetical protein
LEEPGFFYLGFYYTGGSVYAQRMDLNGNTYWPTWPGGVGALMCSRAGWNFNGGDFHYRYPYFSGAFDMSHNDIDLMVVQKLDSLGNRMLGDFGATITAESTGPYDFNDVNSISDDEEGVIAVYVYGADASLFRDIYAKRCNADGTLGGPFPLEVTLTPQTLPIVIPSSGGSFTYDIAIADTSPVAGLVDVWVEVVFPGGSTLTLLARNDLPFQPGDTLSRMNVQQSVPASAPSGVYMYAVKAGNYPYASPWGQDSFTFVKQGGEAHQGTYPAVNSPGGGLDPSTAWTLQGWEESDVGASAAADSPPSIPGQLLLLVSPNPFNLETTISFTLPTAQETQLIIYDVHGREVALLLSGPSPAGAHTISWNADQQSSGIYLVRLQTEAGEVSQKILLLK